MWLSCTKIGDLTRENGDFNRENGDLNRGRLDLYQKYVMKPWKLGISPRDLGFEHESFRYGSGSQWCHSVQVFIFLGAPLLFDEFYFNRASHLWRPQQCETNRHCPVILIG
jgi:hypothetical protein